MPVSDTSSAFGQWLRQSRERLDLTQAELALRAGYSKGTIRKLESGELRPSRQLAEILAEQLAVPPEEREAFVQFARAQTPAVATPPGSHADPSIPWRTHPLPNPNNLPIALTSFVGRAQERADVKRLLAAERLLTLTGVGGIGKTRLALQVAARLCADSSESGAYAGGVWLVEFAQLFDPKRLVPQAVTSVVGVREQTGRPVLGTLIDGLRAQELLLVLDNCEHLLEPIAALALALLHACPRLKILATSREPLAVPGETCYAVPPLSTPRVPMLSSAAELRPEAVQLFVARALAVQPSFSLSSDRAPLIAALCMRLDGIPLAIELAAARLRSLSLEQIVSHLDDRFGLLTTGPRTAVPRQQTLRATIDWSYELLPDNARLVFRRLSVFAGGFTLEAAEQVGAGEPLTSAAVLDVLARLVDHSLVTLDQQDQSQRYHMLETIRQYANEKLLESGEAERVLQRYLQFFLQLAESAEPHLIGGQVIWLNRLEMEHDNLRAALAWSRTAEGDAAGGLRLAGTLFLFWDRHAHFREGQQQLLAALAGPGASDRAARAKALNGAAHMAYMQSDYAAARSLGEASVSDYRALGRDGQRGLAFVLDLLGYMESEVGDYATAMTRIEESLGIVRELNDPPGIAKALQDLGTCMLRMGDFDAAAQCLQEALSLSPQIENPYGSAIILYGLGGNSAAPRRLRACGRTGAAEPEAAPGDR